MLLLTQAKADGTYTKALQTLAKIDLLILDDRGLEPFKSRTTKRLKGKLWMIVTAAVQR